MSDFKSEIPGRIAAMNDNEALQKSAMDFLRASAVTQYSYNFHWMGRPIIQYPQDMVAMQELIWEVKPDLVIETGIAHGGSLIASAAQLALHAGDDHLISFDRVIQVMKRTGDDMRREYKETSEGGLAVSLPEC